MKIKSSNSLSGRRGNPASVRSPFYRLLSAVGRPFFRRASVFFFVLGPALLLFSCAAGGLKVSAQPGKYGARVIEGAHVIENVPFYPQKEHQCGPASLAEVMNYYGAKTTASAIAGDIYSKTARGTLDIDMPLYAGRAGFMARQYRGAPGDIRKEIDRGRPLVVFVDYGFWVYQQGHFMVVVGYDKDGIVAHTGATPFKHVAWREFLGPWKKTGFWSLLIIPKNAGSNTGSQIGPPKLTSQGGKTR
ncbi:MAG: C39 family peptidase [Nitrospiraceae bacterium]|nr:C39 family peptidase [Nitrospiraceae bacterium]